MKIQGTTDLLNDEDEKLLRFIQTVKNNIGVLIGRDKLINKMREIINNSEHFSFRSKRNEKLISLSKPLFVLKFDINQLSNDLNHQFNDLNKDTVLIQRLVQHEITSVFSQFLSEQMRNKELLKELIEKYQIDMSENDLMLLSFITASIFSINVDLKTKLVYLEYVI